MKINEWTLGLAAVGLVSLASVAQADENKLVPVLTEVSSTTISGYVDTAAEWRPGGQDGQVGRLYDTTGPGGASKENGISLNVVSISLDKPLDEGKLSAGYHVQMLAGPEATTRAVGILNPGGTSTDFALNEAYIVMRAPVGNGLDFQAGQFGTWAGYESFDGYKDANYSRSYGFFMEPSAHVGVTAKYTFASWLSAGVGVGNSYSKAIDASGPDYTDKTYLGRLDFTAPESAGFLKDAKLTLVWTGGRQDYTANTPLVIETPFRPVTGNIETYYAGVTVPTPIKQVTVGAAWDYRDANDYFAHALAGYVNWSVTDKFKLNGRVDWAQGSANSFYSTTLTAANDDLLACTLTADYSLWANVITRAEFRWDHSLNGQTPFDNTGVAGTGSERNATTVALNVIYKF
jgi:hypothetical protein